MDPPIPSAPSAAPVTPGAAFAHRDFRRYVVSSLALNLGAQMTSVAVGWQIYALTHRAISLGYVGLVQFAPVLVLTLPGGNVADRFDRGRIVAICNVTLALCVLALCGLAVAHAGAAPIYAVLFFVGVARAFLAPAAQATVPGLVPPEHFANAVTWTSTTWQVSTIAGPALGGVLYGAGQGADLGLRDRGGVDGAGGGGGVRDAPASASAHRAPGGGARARRRGAALRLDAAGDPRVDLARSVRGAARRGDRALADLRQRHPPRRTLRSRSPAQRPGRGRGA